MASTRIFVSYATTKSSRYERDIAAQFILDLQAARGEVITASESIFDDNFMQFLYTELPRCQYVILVQNAEAIQSPRVQSTINLALTLVSQGRIKEVLRLVVAPLAADREPPTIAKLRAFDATQDYLRARDRLLLYLDLLTLEKDPDETFIASRDMSNRTANEGAPVTTMDSSSPNNAAPVITRYNTPPVGSYIPGGENGRKEPFYPQQNEPPAPPPAAMTVQPAPPKERNGKFLPGRNKQSQIDRPVPLRDKYQIAPIWVIIFSAIQVLTLLFALGVLIWGRAPATNTGLVVKATPTAAPSSFTNQLNTLIQAATQSQQNPYGKSNKLVVNDALDTTTRTSSDNGWENLNNEKALSCQFSNQSYMLSTHGPGNCLATRTSYKDLTYQIQMTITQGQAGGLIFRANISPQAYFKFIITVNGNYIIERNDNNNLDYQIQGGFSPAIKQGLNQANLIAISATGQTLDFYVNLQHVATIQDNHNQAAGSIGVTASGPNEDFTTQALFKYAKVWSSEQQNG
ncbi:toll/interleukin-1 receptor domain-containing protein [Dictyobacter aurantiacus]|uniref:TIR domain-containing protein n=1 Tax=Dictyobacter aurantiacus TaxID=1936993 RepID=A0A401ZF41_9CHLR|nr:toll/interleukin-1 receptor domain-containing protein [Dictyobacter aurantiacus]GCE05485.1 hypothetical protein KDAU_28140 [Dictyobacter aurantiacus]